MLDHLFSLYRQSESRGARWLAVEARQWLSQYSVSADDIAFTMGVKLHDYALALACNEPRNEPRRVTVNTLGAYLATGNRAQRRAAMATARGR